MTHNLPGFDWDDLKHLLAVARHGSTLAAGRALGVDQSTVQRRLVELERRIGQALVQRQPSGYRLTEFGQALLPHAERVEQAVQAFEQHIATAAADVSGVTSRTDFGTWCRPIRGRTRGPVSGSIGRYSVPSQRGTVSSQRRLLVVGQEQRRQG